MDLINDFRDKNIILALSNLIKKEAKNPINIMEICGGHTHSIMKFGLSTDQAVLCVSCQKLQLIKR